MTTLKDLPYDILECINNQIKPIDPGFVSFAIVTNKPEFTNHGLSDEDRIVIVKTLIEGNDLESLQKTLKNRNVLRLCVENKQQILRSCINNKHGSVDIFKYITEILAITIEDIRSERNWALRFACANGHLHIVQYLLERFPELNIKDIRSEQNLDLRCACHNGHLHVVRFLLEKFPELNI